MKQVSQIWRISIHGSHSGFVWLLRCDACSFCDHQWPVSLLWLPVLWWHEIHFRQWHWGKVYVTIAEGTRHDVLQALANKVINHDKPYNKPTNWRCFFTIYLWILLWMVRCWVCHIRSLPTQEHRMELDVYPRMGSFIWFQEDKCAYTYIIKWTT